MKATGYICTSVCVLSGAESVFVGWLLPRVRGDWRVVSQPDWEEVTCVCFVKKGLLILRGGL